ncbi:MAG TPA: VOC family protein [Thermoplasmata archaeon]|nr:VOC family protein [Thermoplasmata archaeon]
MAGQGVDVRRVTSVGSLDELHLVARDLDGMERFYTEVLGLGVEFRHEGEMVGLRSGKVMLVLTRSRVRARGASLGFTCRRLDATLRRLRGLGARPLHPVWGGHWGARIAEFRDPEGNTLYLEEPQGIRRSDHHHHGSRGK